MRPVPGDHYVTHTKLRLPVMKVIQADRSKAVCQIPGYYPLMEYDRKDLVKAPPIHSIVHYRR